MDYFAVVETGSNQNTIFGSNKLRENIGASYLLRKVTVDNAKACLGARPHELVTCTSGRVLVRFSGSDSHERARGFVRNLTQLALIEAPRVHLFGATGPVDMTSATTYQASLDALIVELGQNRGRWPSSAGRFPAAPFVARCLRTGLPATGFESGSKDQEALSAVSLGNRRAATEAMGWLSKQFPGVPSTLEDLDQLENLQWLAVIHADGNGIGQLFAQLASRLPVDATALDLENRIRNVSIALEEVTRAALEKAIQKANRAVVPLIVAGDDITVLCEGTRALEFTVEFLKQFEAGSKGENKALGMSLAQAAGFDEDSAVSACAGVSIAKPNHPFSDSYHLAEELTQATKTAVKESEVSVRESAFDFHIQFDSVTTSLASIRERARVRWQQNECCDLFFRPIYPNGTASGHGSWDQLHKQAESIQSKDFEGRLTFPRSMLVEIAQSVYEGRAKAQRVLEQHQAKRPDLPWNELFPHVPLLCHRSKSNFYTLLHDALSYAKLQESA